MALTLTAYLDESGTHDGSPVTVMAGMLANAAQWEAFDANFQRMKEKHRFKIFHTKKLKKRDGDFRGWSDRQIFAMMNDLAMITSTAFTEGVSFTLDNADYETEYRSGSGPRKLRLDSKYGLCFRQCLLFFCFESIKVASGEVCPKLHFVLESGHENAGDALRIFNETKKELQAANCDMLGDLIFAGKDECDRLMMADFLAHVSFMIGNMGGRAPDHWRPPTDIPRPEESLAPGESGVTHLQFKPGGLSDIKTYLIDRLKSRATPTGRPA